MSASALRRIGQMLLIPILAVFTALVVGAVIMWIFGDDPIAAYRGLFNGAVGSARAWSTTIRKMTPLILTGLSVAIAFKAGLFNIGAEGCFEKHVEASGVGVIVDGGGEVYVHLFPVVAGVDVAIRGFHNGAAG